MSGQIAILSPDLQAVIEAINETAWTTNVAVKLNKLLAESEGRFDLYARDSDFGSVVRHRRSEPALRDKDGKLIPEASTAGPLPVKKGRFVGGWNWKVKGLNASVVSQVPYARHARKAGDDPGTALENVAEWLGNDWTEVADAMAEVIAKEIGG